MSVKVKRYFRVFLTFVGEALNLGGLGKGRKGGGITTARSSPRPT